VNDEPLASQTPSRDPRSVPAHRAMAWFADAIRLWKRGPFAFSVMAVVLIVTVVALEPVPIAGLLAANVLAPLLASGFLYGSLAADRDSRPRVAHLLAVFVAPPRAQLAIVAAGLFVTMVESVVAWALADVNLLMPTGEMARLPTSVIVSVYAAGVLASLPVTFVPMAVLFDSESPGTAFASSLRAFTLNLRPLLALAMYSYVLLMAGLATMGIGLVLVLPWIAAASYSAWKDIFGLATTRKGNA
jgi:hypothetical protein